MRMRHARGSGENGNKSADGDKMIARHMYSMTRLNTSRRAARDGGHMCVPNVPYFEPDWWHDAAP